VWDFVSAMALIEALVERLGPERPRSMVLAFPGPVLGFKAQFTNSGWILDCLYIFRRFGLENGLLQPSRPRSRCGACCRGSPFAWR
jgi:glucokinase